MIFRIFHEETAYVIEAPEGSRVVFEEGRSEELVVFEQMPGGLVVERRLPPSVVLNAARRGCLGLAIRQVRSPWMHPEVESFGPPNDDARSLPQPGSRVAGIRRSRFG
jgi:hypothetical protein